MQRQLLMTGCSPVISGPPPADNRFIRPKLPSFLHAPGRCWLRRLIRSSAQQQAVETAVLAGE